MTQEELFREFQSRVKEKRESLNKSDCPEGYAFEEYQEGWRSAFSWATHILAKLISDHHSIPSNLDEAAKKAYKEYDVKTAVKPKEHPVGFLFFDGFKAGAEWMAGQGQTFGAHVDNGCAIASGVELPFVLCDTYEDGDVLKVQIRKK